MKNEIENSKIFEKIKVLLKRNNKTYTDLAKHLHITVPAIKKMFQTEEMNLSRFISIAQFLEISTAELLNTNEVEKKTYTFSQEEELFFSKNLKTLQFLYDLIDEKSIEEIVKESNLDKIVLQEYISVLLKFKLIKLNTKNQLKINIPRHIVYDENGPLGKKTFEHFFKKFSNHTLQTNKTANKNLYINVLEWNMTEIQYKNLIEDINILLHKHREIVTYNSKFKAKSERKTITGVLIFDKIKLNIRY